MAKRKQKKIFRFISIILTVVTLISTNGSFLVWGMSGGELGFTGTPKAQAKVAQAITVEEIQKEAQQQKSHWWDFLWFGKNNDKNKNLFQNTTTQLVREGVHGSDEEDMIELEKLLDKPIEITKDEHNNIIIKKHIITYRDKDGNFHNCQGEECDNKEIHLGEIDESFNPTDPSLQKELDKYAEITKDEHDNIIIKKHIITYRDKDGNFHHCQGEECNNKEIHLGEIDESFNPTDPSLQKELDKYAEITKDEHDNIIIKKHIITYRDKDGRFHDCQGEECSNKEIYLGELSESFDTKQLQFNQPQKTEEDTSWLSKLNPFNWGKVIFGGGNDQVKTLDDIRHIEIDHNFYSNKVDSTFGVLQANEDSGYRYFPVIKKPLENPDGRIKIYYCNYKHCNDRLDEYEIEGYNIYKENKGSKEKIGYIDKSYFNEAVDMYDTYVYYKKENILPTLVMSKAYDYAVDNLDLNMVKKTAKELEELFLKKHPNAVKVRTNTDDVLHNIAMEWDSKIDDSQYLQRLKTECRNSEYECDAEEEQSKRKVRLWNTPLYKVKTSELQDGAEGQYDRLYHIISWDDKFDKTKEKEKKEVIFRHELSHAIENSDPSDYAENLIDNSSLSMSEFIDRVVRHNDPVIRDNVKKFMLSLYNARTGDYYLNDPTEVTARLAQFRVDLKNLGIIDNINSPVTKGDLEKLREAKKKFPDKITFPTKEFLNVIKDDDAVIKILNTIANTKQYGLGDHNNELVASTKPKFQPYNPKTDGPIYDEKGEQIILKGDDNKKGLLAKVLSTIPSSFFSGPKEAVADPEGLITDGLVVRKATGKDAGKIVGYTEKGKNVNADLDKMMTSGDQGEDLFGFGDNTNGINSAVNKNSEQGSDDSKNINTGQTNWAADARNLNRDEKSWLGNTWDKITGLFGGKKKSDERVDALDSFYTAGDTEGGGDGQVAGQNDGSSYDELVANNRSLTDALRDAGDNSYYKQTPDGRVEVYNGQNERVELIEPDGFKLGNNSAEDARRLNAAEDYFINRKNNNLTDDKFVNDAIVTDENGNPILGASNDNGFWGGLGSSLLKVGGQFLPGGTENIINAGQKLFGAYRRFNKANNKNQTQQKNPSKIVEAGNPTGAATSSDFFPGVGLNDKGVRVIKQLDGNYVVTNDTGKKILGYIHPTGKKQFYKNDDGTQGILYQYKLVSTSQDKGSSQGSAVTTGTGGSDTQIAKIYKTNINGRQYVVGKNEKGRIIFQEPTKKAPSGLELGAKLINEATDIKNGGLFNLIGKGLTGGLDGLMHDATQYFDEQGKPISSKVFYYTNKDKRKYQKAREVFKELAQKGTGSVVSVQMLESDGKTQKSQNEVIEYTRKHLEPGERMVDVGGSRKGIKAVFDKDNKFKYFINKDGTITYREKEYSALGDLNDPEVQQAAVAVGTLLTGVVSAPALGIIATLAGGATSVYKNLTKKDQNALKSLAEKTGKSVDDLLEQGSKYLNSDQFSIIYPGGKDEGFDQNISNSDKSVQTLSPKKEEKNKPHSQKGLWHKFINLFTNNKDKQLTEQETENFDTGIGEEISGLNDNNTNISNNNQDERTTEEFDNAERGFGGNPSEDYDNERGPRELVKQPQQNGSDIGESTSWLSKLINWGKNWGKIIFGGGKNDKNETTNGQALVPYRDGLGVQPKDNTSAPNAPPQYLAGNDTAGESVAGESAAGENNNSNGGDGGALNSISIANNTTVNNPKYYWKDNSGKKHELVPGEQYKKDGDSFVKCSDDDLTYSTCNYPRFWTNDGVIQSDNTSNNSTSGGQLSGDGEVNSDLLAGQSGIGGVAGSQNVLIDVLKSLQDNNALSTPAILDNTLGTGLQQGVQQYIGLLSEGKQPDENTLKDLLAENIIRNTGNYLLTQTFGSPDKNGEMQLGALGTSLANMATGSLVGVIQHNNTEHMAENAIGNLIESGWNYLADITNGGMSDQNIQQPDHEYSNRILVNGIGRGLNQTARIIAGGGDLEDAIRQGGATIGNAAINNYVQNSVQTIASGGQSMLGNALSSMGVGFNNVGSLNAVGGALTAGTGSVMSQLILDRQLNIRQLGEDVAQKYITDAIIDHVTDGMSRQVATQWAGSYGWGINAGVTALRHLVDGNLSVEDTLETVTQIGGQVLADSLASMAVGTEAAAGAIGATSLSAGSTLAAGQTISVVEGVTFIGPAGAGTGAAGGAAGGGAAGASGGGGAGGAVGGGFTGGLVAGAWAAIIVMGIKAVFSIATGKTHHHVPNAMEIADWRQGISEAVTPSMIINNLSDNEARRILMAVDQGNSDQAKQIMDNALNKSSLHYITGIIGLSGFYDAALALMNNRITRAVNNEFERGDLELNRDDFMHTNDKGMDDMVNKYIHLKNKLKDCYINKDSDCVKNEVRNLMLARKKVYELAIKRFDANILQLNAKIHQLEDELSKAQGELKNQLRAQLNRERGNLRNVRMSREAFFDTIHHCPNGQLWDDVVGICDNAQIACARRGSSWKLQNGRCINLNNDPIGKTQCDRLGAGYRWDNNRHMCVGLVRYDPCDGMDEGGDCGGDDGVDTGVITRGNIETAKDNSRRLHQDLEQADYDNEEAEGE